MAENSPLGLLTPKFYYRITSVVMKKNWGCVKVRCSWIYWRNTSSKRAELLLMPNRVEDSAECTLTMCVGWYHLNTNFLMHFDINRAYVWNGWDFKFTHSIVQIWQLEQLKNLLSNLNSQIEFKKWYESTSPKKEYRPTYFKSPVHSWLLISI